jgi:predicted RNA binding protein YcfA (HicA-like mRNA interferase family)
MPKTPVISGKELIKNLEKYGYYVVRQRGNHIRLKHEFLKSISVPDHKFIKPGLLLKILKDANLNLNDLRI